MGILSTKEAFNSIYKDVEWSSPESKAEAYSYFNRGATYKNSAPPPGRSELANAILDYLNNSKKKIPGNENLRGFRLTDSVKRLINARIKEGFATEDFTAVIDYKCHEWGGTDFEQYIQPSTLFRASKFPEYLCAAGNFKKLVRSEVDRGIDGLME